MLEQSHTGVSDYSRDHIVQHVENREETICSLAYVVQPGLINQYLNQHFFARRQLLSSQVSTSCMLERALEGCSVGAERLGLTCPNVTRCPGLERQQRTLMEGVDCVPEACVAVFGSQKFKKI